MNPSGLGGRFWEDHFISTPVSEWIAWDRLGGPERPGGLHCQLRRGHALGLRGRGAALGPRGADARGIGGAVGEGGGRSDSGGGGLGEGGAWGGEV